VKLSNFAYFRLYPHSDWNEVFYIQANPGVTLPMSIFYSIRRIYMLNKKYLFPIITTLVIVIIALGVAFGYKAYIHNKVEKGEKQITVTIIVNNDEQKFEKEHTFWTEADFLGIALEEEFEVVTESYSFGRVLLSIEGISSDFNKNYWSIYVNGEASMVGMDEVALKHKDEIKIELTSIN
jgi:Domain of unknown function (DUF4430)